MPDILISLSLLLVALVAAEGYVLFRLREGSESEDEAADPEGEEEEEIEPLDLTYVARVVEREDGEEIGESVCVADERVIVKSPEGFYAVPVANVAESGESLVAADVDWDRARDVGGDWAEDHHDPMEYDGEGLPRSG